MKALVRESVTASIKSMSRPPLGRVSVPELGVLSRPFLGRKCVPYLGVVLWPELRVV